MLLLFKSTPLLLILTFHISKVPAHVSKDPFATVPDGQVAAVFVAIPKSQMPEHSQTDYPKGGSKGGLDGGAHFF